MKFNVTYGGWYQRTTLHLSEIYDLFVDGKSSLNLSKTELQKHKKSLNLESVSRHSDYFEYVKAIEKSGIEIRYYEDGLYVLEMETEDIREAQKELEKYYQEKINPALSYIFSLGAPTPKILANIKTKHPTVVSVYGIDANNFSLDEHKFGKAYSKLNSSGVTVQKTPDYIFIIAPNHTHKSVLNLIEMQIFFREFKDQLEKYLAIHRTIWEEISEIKEAKTIIGKEVDSVRGKLDGYQKTISLIGNRINQMGSYINTRSSIAKHYDIEKNLIDLFEYKFETLTDTLSYIKEIWKMTGDYLSQAVSNLVEIKNQSTSNNLKSLQTITSIGVISGVLGYLSANKLPSISVQGLIYFIILFCLTWLMNAVIAKKYKNKKYSLKFGGNVSNI
ncbi:MAG: hypothetical protein WAW92_01950 [Minisyncoccia bacterium]